MGAPPDHAIARGLFSTAGKAVVAAFCASLVGIGLARFAYTPLLPALIDAHWFAPAAAAYLGAANLAGYLIGALGARPLARRRSPRALLRGAMLLAAFAFIACAWPMSAAWFFTWRLLSGIAGGLLMVLAAPTVLPLVAPSRRGVAGGVIFMGIGVGIAASGTLVPLLLRQGLSEAWMGLGLMALVLTAVAWEGWPPTSPAIAHTTHTQGPAPLRPLRALYVEYALNATGWVPHMIFLVDFVARGLRQGIAAGTAYWVLFGLGATVGPVLAGLVADRTSFARALRSAFMLEAVAVVIPAVATDTVSLVVSSLVVGAFVTGTVPLVLGRVHEILVHHPSRHGDAWRVATVVFALFQALAAYAMSYAFSVTGGSYALLFVIGSVAMLLALLIDMVAMQATDVAR